ncbi:MAG: lactate dehydrogenase [Clostridia bacterium BRH_c25]|nr:MAG: lactate dehydrogenase [Clostridia bacterium BRH_c25]
MFYYKHCNRTLVSLKSYEQINEISEAAAASDTGRIFALTSGSPKAARRSFCVSQSDLLFTSEENLRMLLLPRLAEDNLPAWLLQAVHNNRVTMLNTDYPNWEDVLLFEAPEKWRINVVGLGDVGGTLVSGLRLLGGDCISDIGIYDIDPNKVKRWEFEANQIMDPSGILDHPPVLPISEDQLFDCDMFIFCVTVGVPPISENPGDVRIAQYEGNLRIIKQYALSARANCYKGIFAVVSDPVDLLCKAAFDFSNTDSSGRLDFKGLAAEQTRGYGLGVMHARAAYYAGLSNSTAHYIKEGRAFGPHGEGLIIADSIVKYNDLLSRGLTEKAKTANLEVRNLGFKPYVAPALSSGCLSILATIRGQWHYSATFLGGVYLGARNRLLPSGIELERLPIPDELFHRLENTYESLREIKRP